MIGRGKCASLRGSGNSSNCSHGPMKTNNPPSSSKRCPGVGGLQPVLIIIILNEQVSICLSTATSKEIYRDLSLLKLQIGDSRSVVCCCLSLSVGPLVEAFLLTRRGCGSRGCHYVTPSSKGTTFPAHSSAWMTRPGRPVKMYLHMESFPSSTNHCTRVSRLSGAVNMGRRMCVWPLSFSRRMTVPSSFTLTSSQLLCH
jgi:hypothetical protein